MITFKVIVTLRTNINNKMGAKLIACCEGANLCLRPDNESHQLNNYLTYFTQLSYYVDPYYGQCQVLQSLDRSHLVVLLRQEVKPSDSHKRLSLLKQLQIAKNGPASNYLIATKLIINLQRKDFFSIHQELYIEHDFIYTDLLRQFKYRQDSFEQFKEKQIRTILQNCTKGFLWLQFTNYLSIRMDHIYFCSRDYHIKVAHPNLFNYKTNLEVVGCQQDPQAIQRIYLSPQQVIALECSQFQFKGGWISNSFSFGMIILSLMTMKHLNHLYNYQTCQIHFHQLQDLINQCSAHYSVQLVGIVRQLLTKDYQGRMKFTQMYSKMERMEISNTFAHLYTFDSSFRLHSISSRKKVQKKEDQDQINYISKALRPIISREQPLSQHQHSGIRSSLDESIVANKRLTYYQDPSLIQKVGSYMGDTLSPAHKQDLQGLRQGKGIYRHNDGQSYIGEWHRNKMHGYGKLYTIGQQLRYQGQFNDGLFHGNGIQYSINLIKDREDEIDRKYIKLYKGNWISYEGTFIKDVKSGAGKVTFQKGVWRGNFKDGQPNGDGIYLSNKGIQTRGRWQNGQLIEE